jgi:hypothetical protein
MRAYYAETHVIADALAVGGTRRGNERQIDSIIHLCLFFQNVY